MCNPAPKRHFLSSAGAILCKSGRARGGPEPAPHPAPRGGGKEYTKETGIEEGPKGKGVPRGPRRSVSSVAAHRRVRVKWQHVMAQKRER